MKRKTDQRSDLTREFEERRRSLKRSGRIANCPLSYRCPKTWDELEPTEQDDQRHCSGCNKPVFWVSNQQEYEAAVNAKRCIAFGTLTFTSLGLPVMPDDGKGL